MSVIIRNTVCYCNHKTASNLTIDIEKLYPFLFCILVVV